MIDQTRLPLEKKFIDCRTIEEVGHAIKTMVIRGAPAIGVAAAMGASLGADSIEASSFEDFYHAFEEKCDHLGQSRPTAVNLAWAISRMKQTAQRNKSLPITQLKSRLKEEALTILTEDITTNQAMGQHGQTLIKDGNVVLTHCNAGALATAGFGTALGLFVPQQTLEKISGFWQMKHAPFTRSTIDHLGVERRWHSGKANYR